MSATLPRAIMTLAARSLGDHRRDWARAMQAEFEMAAKDGQPLAFATGCLIAAWREMPRHGEGRFALANHAIALGVVLPMAAMMLLAALLGFPLVEFGSPGTFGFLSGKAAPMLILKDGNVAVAPSLTLLVLLLAASHFLVAWLLLEENWVGVMVLARVGGAATITLVVFTVFSVHDPSSTLLPITCLAIQLLAIFALAWWHMQLRHGVEFEAPA